MATTDDTTRELLPSGPTRGRLSNRAWKDPPSGRSMMLYALFIALMAVLLVGLLGRF